MGLIHLQFKHLTETCLYFLFTPFQECHSYRWSEIHHKLSIQMYEDVLIVSSKNGVAIKSPWFKMFVQNWSQFVQ